MPRPKDFSYLVGCTFGRLTVLTVYRHRPSDEKRSRAVADCTCDCGNLKTVEIHHLENGWTKSCGCLCGVARGGDGQSHTTEYRTWSTMMSRCNNPKSISYSRYGGRGIGVCDRWSGVNGYANFFSDMGKRPSKDHSLDRIDNCGNYSPENCRWASRAEQNANRERTAAMHASRKPVFITHDGFCLCASHWAERLGIPRKVITYNIRKGRTLQDVIQKYAP